MELKATPLGKRLAQHPYDRAVMLNAGVKVSGDQHEYLIPFNKLLAIHCKRGLVWGELEFVLSEDKVVRLHGTEWSETQQFHRRLDAHWRRWSQEMSDIAEQALQQQWERISERTGENQWLTCERVRGMEHEIRQTFAALPLPISRLEEFDNCRDIWRKCLAWLQDSERSRQQHNQAYADAMLEAHADFFTQIESSPLNPSQARAVMNGEPSLLVLAGAGSGKTSVLVARAGWLLARGQADAGQILLLSFGCKAAEEMDERIRERLHTEEVTARTFHSLALHIIQQGSKKAPIVSKLESDAAARHQLFLNTWRQQCGKKKAQAKGWRQWLEEMQWTVPEGNFWDDETLQRRLAPRLERWVSLMRMHGGAQEEMIADAPEECRELFSKRIKLIAPLLKAWKSELKAKNAVDFSGLIHQAVVILEKGRFISPWKHILVDEFQDISPQRVALLKALRKQNSQTTLFAVGDDWQAIYRFSGAQFSLTTAFHQTFGEGEHCHLDTTYRFNSRIGDIANRFVQQNPHQLKKPLNSLTVGDKKAVTLLDESQLDTLLDKLSGYAKEDERILVLARYHHLKPASLQKAATRWPKLQIDFMTIHASKGQQADYVILVGLQDGNDGFPAPARESIMEDALLPQIEDFPDAEERRLLYVALTRARERVWLLFNKDHPSRFVEELKQLDVPVARKP